MENAVRDPERSRDTSKPSLSFSKISGKSTGQSMKQLHFHAWVKTECQVYAAQSNHMCPAGKHGFCAQYPIQQVYAFLKESSKTKPRSWTKQLIVFIKMNQSIIKPLFWSQHKSAIPDDLQSASDFPFAMAPSCTLMDVASVWHWASCWCATASRVVPTGLVRAAVGKKNGLTN